MGHQALQRVVVRMMYDASFANQVIEKGHKALSGVDLREEEIEWLTLTDARAFTTDEHRLDRTLKALIDEYPRSTAIIFRRDANLFGLAEFFTQQEFHDAIQNRGSLALAFGDYLKRYAGSLEKDLANTVQIEKVLAELRRASRTPHAIGGEYALAPTVRLLVGPAGTLDFFTALGNSLASLSQDVSAAALSGQVDLANLPSLSAVEMEHILVITHQEESAGVSLEVCPRALYQLLLCADGGCSKEALAEVAHEAGADEYEAMDIISGLLADRILTVVMSGIS